MPKHIQAEEVPRFTAYYMNYNLLTLFFKKLLDLFKKYSSIFFKKSPAKYKLKY